jgi:hypothetical protein
MVNLTEYRPRIDGAFQSPVGHGLVEPALPTPGRFVLVQCRYFRCLGYYDARGKWRNAQTVQELPDVKAWCGIEDDTFIPVS